MAGIPNSLRKPAQRAERASRTVEVGMAALCAAGRGGWVRGRALAGPEGRESCAVRGGAVALRTGTRIMRKAFSNTY
jgi:hypothetical protein